MLEDWDMLDVDEDEKLTGEEEFELLAGPLGLNDRRIVPEPVQFPDSDPLGASVAMVTAINSMEETLMQIGKPGGRLLAPEAPGHPLACPALRSRLFGASKQSCLLWEWRPPGKL